MKPRNRIELLALIARVLLGVWFVYSGGLKLWGTGLDRFVTDIGNYKLLQPPLDAMAAYTVPWLELLAGLCLMLGLWMRGAIGVLFGLVCGFCLFIAWAWGHQLDISCGCHGSDAPIQYWAKVVEFLVYFSLLTWLWRLEGKAATADLEQNLQNMA